MTITDAGTQLRTAPMAVFYDSGVASPRMIGQAIQSAVDAIGDGRLKPFSRTDDTPCGQSRAALALLADCYARQIYSSAIIAALAARDSVFLRQWRGDLPDGHALRRFRVEQRGMIHRCLMAALRFLAEQKVSAGALTKVDAAQLAEEASRRIIMAAFVDSMELDGE